MELIEAYWTYFAIALVAYVVGKIHGRSVAEAERIQEQQTQVQQQVWMDMMKKMGGADER